MLCFPRAGRRRRWQTHEDSVMQIKLNSSTLAPETKTVLKTVDNLSSLVSSSCAHEFSTLDSQCSRSSRIAERDLNHWTWRHTDWKRKATKDNNEEKGGEKARMVSCEDDKRAATATTLCCRFQHEITCWRPKSVNFSAENYPHVADFFSFCLPRIRFRFILFCNNLHSFACRHACVHR